MDLPDCVWALLEPERSRELRKWQAPEPEELRFRIGQSCKAISKGKCFFDEGTPVTANELDKMVARAAKSSLYAHEEELRRGYLHIASGVRMGICGTAYSRNSLIAGVRSITSVSIRIPREIPICVDRLYHQITNHNFRNTLIVSPPGFGKTTLLRAMIRYLSESGRRVAVADERGEIAAASDRVFGFDLGPNTDVLSEGNKAESAMILARAMNPEILAFDEITAPDDVEMITQVTGCGVTILATAHGADRTSMRKRTLYRSLFDTGIFESVIWIYQRDGERVYVAESL